MQAAPMEIDDNNGAVPAEDVDTFYSFINEQSPQANPAPNRKRNTTQMKTRPPRGKICCPFSYLQSLSKTLRNPTKTAEQKAFESTMFQYGFNPEHDYRTNVPEKYEPSLKNVLKRETDAKPPGSHFLTFVDGNKEKGMQEVPIWMRIRVKRKAYVDSLEQLKAKFQVDPQRLATLEKHKEMINALQPQNYWELLANSDEYKWLLGDFDMFRFRVEPPTHEWKDKLPPPNPEWKASDPFRFLFEEKLWLQQCIHDEYCALVKEHSKRVQNLRTHVMFGNPRFQNCLYYNKLCENQPHLQIEDAATAEAFLLHWIRMTEDSFAEELNGAAIHFPMKRDTSKVWSLKNVRYVEWHHDGIRENPETNDEEDEEAKANRKEANKVVNRARYERLHQAIMPWFLNSFAASGASEAEPAPAENDSTLDNNLLLVDLLVCNGEGAESFKNVTLYEKMNMAEASSVYSTDKFKESLTEIRDQRAPLIPKQSGNTSEGAHSEERSEESPEARPAQVQRIQSRFHVLPTGSVHWGCVLEDNADSSLVKLLEKSVVSGRSYHPEIRLRKADNLDTVQSICNQMARVNLSASDWTDESVSDGSADEDASEDHMQSKQLLAQNKLSIPYHSHSQLAVHAKQLTDGSVTWAAWLTDPNNAKSVALDAQRRAYIDSSEHSASSASLGLQFRVAKDDTHLDSMIQQLSQSMQHVQFSGMPISRYGKNGKKKKEDDLKEGLTRAVREWTDKERKERDKEKWEAIEALRAEATIAAADEAKLKEEIAQIEALWHATPVGVPPPVSPAPTVSRQELHELLNVQARYQELQKKYYQLQKKYYLLEAENDELEKQVVDNEKRALKLADKLRAFEEAKPNALGDDEPYNSDPVDSGSGDLTPDSPRGIPGTPPGDTQFGSPNVGTPEGATFAVWQSNQGKAPSPPEKPTVPTSSFDDDSDDSDEELPRQAPQKPTKRRGKGGISKGSVRQPRFR